MLEVPGALVAVFLFVLGSIVGSFLDVFTLRFHTGASINGRSHCLSCGQVLDWYELFPLFSYLFLRGRCRVCQSRIPARLFLMELGTGGLFVLVWYVAENWHMVSVGLLFAMLAIVITVYDVRHLVIPNAFVFATGAVTLLHLGWVLWPEFDLLTIVSYLVSGLLAFCFYASLWLVSQGRWIGLGDAKLALPLAATLSISQTFSFVVLSFWVGAGVSVALLLFQWGLKRGQTYLRFLRVPLTMKSEVPFAPFLLVAFALVYFFHVDVLRFFALTL